MSILTSCQKCFGEIDINSENLPTRACDSFVVVCRHCNQKHICNWYPKIDIRIKQDEVKNEKQTSKPYARFC